MSATKFKTLRHIETVRNYIATCIKELMDRQEQHDQTKLQEPEQELFKEFTPKLKETTYGSDKYKTMLVQLEPALEHHYSTYRHHPEHFKNRIDDMNLIDLLEMICDWKSATLRHADGDIFKSLGINGAKYNISPQLSRILKNTVQWLEKQNTFHHAEES